MAAAELSQHITKEEKTLNKTQHTCSTLSILQHQHFIWLHRTGILIH